MELNLVAHFPNPFQGNPKAELAAIKNDKWFPSTDDFKGVAGTSSIEISSAWSLLAEIKKTAKPIARLNFFTHGITGVISFRGTIDPNTATVTFDSADDAAFGQIFGKPKAIADPYAKKWGDLGENSSQKVQIDSTSLSLDDVRAKFASDAVIWLYLCHGASDPLLLQQVANAFQVTVKSFSNAIVYCAPSNFPTSRKHRVVIQTTAVPKDSCPNAVLDFRQLDTDPNVRTATPKKP
jgi:hypothetical protein